jgi:hypothetical protein
VLGASFADGRFLADRLAYPDTAAPATGYDYDASITGGRFHQQTWGADAEYSAGYFLVRAEFVTAGWRLPATGTPAITERLRAAGLMAEGRYRLMPGLTAAVRVDRLDFNDIQGTYQRAPWDAPVTRVEGGLAWTVTRNVILRGSVQRNTRTRGAVTSSTLPALQATVWF